MNRLTVFSQNIGTMLSEQADSVFQEYWYNVFSTGWHCFLRILVQCFLNRLTVFSEKIGTVFYEQTDSGF